MASNGTTLDSVPAAEIVPNGTSRELYLPHRRREQLKRVLNGESIGEASRAAGYKTKQSGSNALSDTRKRLLAAMDHYKLTPETYVREYLLPMLNATHTQYFAWNGEVTDERTDPDNGTRLAAIKEVGKLMQLYPKETDNGIGALNIQINGIVVNGDGE